MGEFELIRRYFCTEALQPTRRDVYLGVGDDCALISVPQGRQLALSVDTSTAGVHFLPQACAHSIGWRALAVSLSDLAAMGAQPAWFTLALSLPEVDESWLAEFSRGMSDLAQRYGIALVGGDTTRGELSVTVQVQGYISPGTAWKRSGARPDDLIYVSGTLGDAAVGLKLAQQRLAADLPLPQAPPGQPDDVARQISQDEAFLLSRYLYPEPRFDLLSVLSSRASAAIDISDGLVADLKHLLTASNVGARIDVSRIPLSDAIRKLGDDKALSFALGGGDDYQLCFTVSPQRRLELEVSAEQSGIALYPIGVITRERGIHGLSSHEIQGYDHFKGAGR